LPVISAVINTRNEENNIRYCLETLKWCDEIIVVDMESEDRTVEIAREYTDKIYKHKKVLAFDIARKFAVEKATGDWILLVDADEMVPKPLALTLMEIAAKNEVDIVEISYRHYIMGEWVKHSGWGYTPHPRFFKRGKVLFSETVHNYMKKDDNAFVYRLQPSGLNCIIHFNYIDSTHFINKLNKYTSIEAYHLYNQKNTFSYYGLLKSAIREFYSRFVRFKGYKDGVRGFSLCLMMAFYRALTLIKLWELIEFQDEPVTLKYEKRKLELLREWEAKNP